MTIRECMHDRANGVNATFEVEQVSPEMRHRPDFEAIGIRGHGDPGVRPKLHLGAVVVVVRCKLTLVLTTLA